jgi:hypothetical protein
MNLFDFLAWMSDSPLRVLGVLFGSFAILWLALFVFGLLQHMLTDESTP